MAEIYENLMQVNICTIPVPWIQIQIFGKFYNPLTLDLLKFSGQKPNSKDIFPNSHEKLNGTESQRTPMGRCEKAIRYSGLGVRSVGPVGDFLDKLVVYIMMIYQWWFDGDESIPWDPICKDRKESHKDKQKPYQ